MAVVSVQLSADSKVFHRLSGALLEEHNGSVGACEYESMKPSVTVLFVESIGADSV
jgi:hypothetical protein